MGITRDEKNILLNMLTRHYRYDAALRGKNRYIKTISRLIKKGYLTVERTPRNWRGQGHNKYTLTPLGAAAAASIIKNEQFKPVRYFGSRGNKKIGGGIRRNYDLYGSVVYHNDSIG